MTGRCSNHPKCSDTSCKHHGEHVISNDNGCAEGDCYDWAVKVRCIPANSPTKEAS